MGRVAELKSFARTTDAEGAHVSEAQIDPGGGANVTAVHFACAGDDSHPLPGDFVATTPSAGAGAEQVVGYLDPKNAPQAAAGEKVIYSRDPADGAPIAVVWLKNDGTIVIENGNGSIEMAPGGDVTINGVTIDTNGNVTAPGEVSAMALTPATAVSLSTHLHTAPGGATSAPTPGT